MDVAIGAAFGTLGAGLVQRALSELAEIPAAMIEAGRAAESLERRFRFAAGGSIEAARELAIVRAEARRLGIDFLAAGDAYAGLTAAGRSAGIAQASLRETFIGVAEASRVLGLSADDTRGVLLALEQVAAKGVVSAEELRGQMGERLPIAMAAAARAMNLSIADLSAALDRGDVRAQEFFAGFGRALREEVQDGVPEAVSSAEAAFGRLGNAVDAVGAQIARSGIIDGLAAIAQGIADLIEQGRRLSAPGGILPEDIAGLDRAGLEAQRALLVEQIESLLPREGEISGRAGRVIDARLRRLRSELAQVQALLADLDAPRAAEAAPDPVSAATDPEAAGRRERAAETAADRLVAIERAASRRRLAITDERIQLSLLREQQGLEEVEALLGRGGGAEAAEAARTAITAAAEAERTAIRERAAREVEAQAEREREAERGRIDALIADEQRALDVRAEARSDLRELARELEDPYTRAVGAIEAWRAQTVAAFEAAGLTAEEYASTVDAVVAERLRAAAEAEADTRLAESDRWVDGAVRNLARYAAAADDVAGQIDDVFQSTLRGLEDVLVEFALTGELTFQNLANAIIADLTRIVIRAAITQAIAGAFGGGIFGSVFHSGGVAGEGGVRRQVPAAAFALAPRLHRGGVAGIGPDEVPAILRRGELVVPPEALDAQRPGPMNVRVDVTNRGTPIEAREARAQVDPRGLVISIVTEDLAQGGPIARSLQSFTPGIRL